MTTSMSRGGSARRPLLAAQALLLGYCAYRASQGPGAFVAPKGFPMSAAASAGVRTVSFEDEAMHGGVDRPRGFGTSADSLATATPGAVTHPRGRPESVAMGRQKWHAKGLYKDGWRHGGRNMWMEEGMAGNWMNTTVLKGYIFPSGRVRPRKMTKLRRPDHKRAVRYIKRLRQLGLMPYHRIQAHLDTDPAAKPPVRKMTAGQTTVSRGQMSEETKTSIDES